MRRIIPLGLVAAFVIALFSTDSSACWRRRHRSCDCCPVVSPPCQCAPAQQVPLRIRVGERGRRVGPAGTYAVLFSIANCKGGNGTNDDASDQLTGGYLLRISNNTPYNCTN